MEVEDSVVANGVEDDVVILQEGGTDIAPESPRCNIGDVGGVGNSGQCFTPRRSPRLLEKEANSSRTVGVDKDGVDGEDVIAEVPAVGMVFSTMIDLEKFYKRYAKSVGFGVVRPQGSYRNNKERRATTWRCACFGDPDAKLKRKSKRMAKDRVEFDNTDREVCNPRRRKSKKCFCDAMIYATVNEAREWVIRTVVLEHTNHIPKPSNSKLVKEYRMEALTASVKRRILSDFHSGVPVSKIVNCLAHERGGYDNMPFIEADIRHVVYEHRRLKMQGGDTNALVSYFDKMRLDNPNFYHTHRLDSEGFMKDLFWVDPRSVAAYEEFSDVVCFDTTYLTNQYALPFANFVGVNHHGKTVLFGCALISHEDCDTFEWVFRKWLDCMKGRAPAGILTDQAAAMWRPLEVVMPDTRHRWCIWHILQKLPYKLGSHERYSDLKDDLLDVVYNSLSHHEFERKWQEVVVKYGVESNEWLSYLFSDRHMWIPSFMTDHFWAGMRSTQRCESINSFFDQFLTRDTPFCEFGERYVKAVEKRISQEKIEDEKGDVWKRHYSTGYSIERVFRKIYTCNIFRRLQKECERITYVMVEEEKQVDDANLKYLITDRVWVHKKDDADPTLIDDRTNYCVDFNVLTREATCSCKKFEIDGVMCCHLVRVYDKLQIQDIPEKFILRRWRKDAVRKHSSVRVAYHDLSHTEEVARLGRLVRAYEPITEVASKSEECSEIVFKGLKRIQEEVDCHLQMQKDSQVSASQAELNGISKPNSSSPITSVGEIQRTASSAAFASQCGDTTFIEVENGTPCSANSIRPSIKDPPIPKKRGRPRGSRYKCSVETGWKRKDTGTGSSKISEDQTGPKCKKGSKTQTTGGKGKAKKKSTTVEGNLAGSTEQSQPEKLLVKRRKTVSFAGVVDDSCNLMVENGDELMCRNGLSFDQLDAADLNLV